MNSIRHITDEELLSIWDKAGNKARVDILHLGLFVTGRFSPNDRHSIMCGIWKYQNIEEGRQP